MATKEEILEKIKKTLALASNAGTAGEAEAALKAAARLQDAYGITDEVIKDFITQDINSENINIDIGAIKEKLIIETGRIGVWDILIARTAAVASNCKIYRSRGNGLRAYGLPVDLEVCMAFVKWLQDTSELLRKQYCANNNIRYGSFQGKAWKDGFCEGAYKAALAQKAEKREDKLPVMISTGALVVVNSNALVVARNNALALYAKNTLKLVKGKGNYSIKGGDSYSQGFETGRSQNFNRNVIY